VHKPIQAEIFSGLRRSEIANLSEAEVIRFAQQGDASAFEHIYWLHSRRVHSLCLRMVGNSIEAEDLTQDIFLQVFRKIRTFRGEAAFSTWLHRLAVNIFLIHLRKKTPAQTSLEETIEPNEESGKLPKGLGEHDPRLTGLLDRVNMDRALGQLPPVYRLIFVLHDVQGYRHNEISEILGCSVSNSKSRLHRARMRLRQCLQRERPDQSAQLSSVIVSSITCKSQTAPPAICRVPTDGTDRLERVLEAPSKDRSSAVHGISNFSESSVATAHAVHDTLFDSCLCVEQS
jgi:RNA polymerase sigma-70 factor, ECF subfamily